MKYKLFGKTGLRVSQLVLGTANFGERWGHGTSESDSATLLDAYAEAGGNFIDTADVYQFGQSEEIIGNWLTGKREDFVLATKFTSGASPDANRLVTGNSRKAMVDSLEASLKRLKTDRIDLFWVHQPDAITPAEEIVRGLDDLARAGKILYAGLSNFPAWRLARAVTLAEVTRAVPIAAAQFEYSLAHRDPEADILVACQALGLAVTSWSPLGGGMLTGKYRRGEKGRAEAFGGKVFRAENSSENSSALDTALAIAEELHVTPDQVAIAWVASCGPLPIIGPRTMDQLTSNLGAKDLLLTKGHLDRLNAASDPQRGEVTKAAVSLDDPATEKPLIPVA